MRILILTNLFPTPFQKSRATFNRQQFAALARQHEVAIISPIAWTDEHTARKSNKGVMPHSRTLTIDGISVYYPRYFFPPRLFFGAHGYFLKASIRKAFNHQVDRFKPDIVLGSWAYPDGWTAVKLGHARSIPVVVKVHGSDVLLLKQHPSKIAMTRDALQQANGIIAVSQHLKHEVCNLGVASDRVRVIYNGIDTSLFCRGPVDTQALPKVFASGVPTLLYVGNLVPVKGLDVLIDACLLLARHNVQFHCVLIGGGPMKQDLQRRVQSMGLQDRISFLGVIPHHELPNWFRAASLFVLPSRSEGIPNVLIEACACGTNCVSTTVGGIPEIAERENIPLVPPNDAPALADAIKQALPAPEQTNRSNHSIARRSHDDAAIELAAFLEQVRIDFKRNAATIAH